MTPIVILDTETTGLDRCDDEVWDFAAVRRNLDGTTQEWSIFVEHDLGKAAQLPDRFRADHDARYDATRAISRNALALLLVDEVFAVPEGTPYHYRPHVVGAVPDFDLAHLERIIRQGLSGMPPWHHHIVDAETLAVGYLRGTRAQAKDCGCDPLGDDIPGPPWDSNVLSRAVGVDPDQFARHTAMGDVRWAMAIYDTVMGA